MTGLSRRRVPPIVRSVTFGLSRLWMAIGVLVLQYKDTRLVVFDLYGSFYTQADWTMGSLMSEDSVLTFPFILNSG